MVTLPNYLNVFRYCDTCQVANVLNSQVGTWETLPPMTARLGPSLGSIPGLSCQRMFSKQ